LDDGFAAKVGMIVGLDLSSFKDGLCPTGESAVTSEGYEALRQQVFPAPRNGTCLAFFGIAGPFWGGFDWPVFGV
jgi:hypothetical protein